MTRYRVQARRPARADTTVFSDDEPMVLPHMVVVQPDADWHDSGLLSAEGHPLIRFVGPEPIGFLTREDAA